MTFRYRAINALTMAIVAGMSFALLIFVALGEAQRTYEQFYVEKLTAQNRVMVNAIESFLRRDLPIDQYVGFKPRAERLIASDTTIVAIDLYNQENERVFSAGDSSVGIIPPARQSFSVNPDLERGVSVARDELYLQVVLDLENRSQIAGRVTITMLHASISADAQESFHYLIPLAVVLTLAFASLILVFPDVTVFGRIPVNQLVYAGLFVVMSVFVVTTLAELYSRGIQVKTKALADSLGERMTEVVGFNLDIEKIPGLDRAFAEYLRLNPDIGAAALLVEDEILIHTDPLAVGTRWISDQSVYEYLVDITPASSQRQIEIAVTLPIEIIYWRTARSVKNFAALFIASAFIASIFMQVAANINSAGRDPDRRKSVSAYANEEKSLAVVKPIFYISLCIEHLSYAFIPQLINSTVKSAGLPETFTSTIFTVYYLCFAVSLIPAGYIGQKFSPKLLMLAALMLSTISAGMMLLPVTVETLLLSRGLAGIGQAVLLIGIQSFILSVTAPGRKTQGAAIIVYGFQGGMISGMAIGSLLVNYIGVDGVFSISIVTLVGTFIYAWLGLPFSELQETRKDETIGMAIRSLARDVSVAIKSPDVLATIAFVGIPAKALLTGVVVFALPLLMAANGYRQEDIGQLLMLYAAGVVLANAYIPKIVDKSGQTDSALVFGAILSGAGLFSLSLGGLQAASGGGNAIVDVGFLITGIVLLGLAHGLINAPIVSHVANLPLANEVGVGTLTATYRFLERIGHVAGPLVVGMMFAIGGQSGAILAWLAGIVTVFGTIFWAIHRLRSRGIKQSAIGHAEAAAIQVQSMILSRSYCAFSFNVLDRSHLTPTQKIVLNRSIVPDPAEHADQPSSSRSTRLVADTGSFPTSVQPTAQYAVIMQGSPNAHASEESVGKSERVILAENAAEFLNLSELFLAGYQDKASAAGRTRSSNSLGAALVSHPKSAGTFSWQSATLSDLSMQSKNRLQFVEERQ